MSTAEQTVRRCVLCDRVIEKRAKTGRPRKYCHECAPPGESGSRAWHRLHANEVNRRRREEYVPRSVAREEAERLVCKPWIEAGVD